MEPSAQAKVAAVAATKEIRELKNVVTKSLAMLRMELVARHELIEADYVNRWTLDRSIKAVKEFRTPNIPHRPCKLNEEEEELLLELIEIETKTGPALNGRKVRFLVCLFLFSSFALQFM
jgi:hypothetical protein